MTPLTNDKGADIVCTSDQDSYLIQVKQSIRPLSNSPVQEIMGALATYNKLYNKDFKPMIISNNILNKNASQMASDSNIDVLTLDDLKSKFQNHEVSYHTISNLESNRISL